MSTEVIELLGRFERSLNSLARRQYVVEAVQSEIDRVARGKEFRIWNDVVWLMLLDTRDLNVIHLASWAKSVYESGGLIGQLQAKHAAAFPRQRPRGGGLYEDDDHMNDLLDREHAESFDRLFSSCTCSPYPPAPAFVALRDRFTERLGPVLADRSGNRAHPYEKGTQRGSVKMLNFPELREAFNFSQGFMSDLRRVCHQSTYRYADMNSTSPTEAAEDLVEALLLGTSWRIARTRGATDRDSFYDKLHERYDDLTTPEPKTFFNDHILAPGFP